MVLLHWSFKRFSGLMSRSLSHLFAFFSRLFPRMFLKMAVSPIVLSELEELKKKKNYPKKDQSISEGGRICIVKSINNR